MPMITDWLMVVITAVYVIATIAISCANIKSANATREQLIESKRQFEEKKRLEIMPYIQFDNTTKHTEYELNFVLDTSGPLQGKYVLNMRIKNIGNGTAKDIEYRYQYANGSHNIDKGAFPIQALSSGESQTIMVNFAYDVNEIEEKDACFILRYKDLLENTYKQRLSFKFRGKSSTSLKMIEFSTSSPVLMAKEESNA